MREERWLTLDLHDLVKLMNGRSLRFTLRDHEGLEIVLWGGADVQRIANAARVNVAPPKPKDKE